MDSSLFLSAVLLIVIILVAVKTFIVVPEKSAFIKERLGTYVGTMDAGLHFLVPIIDRVAYRHTLKEEVIDVPPQICITKDNVQVEVDGILYIRVLEAKKASYGINDYRFASIQLAQTNMRSEVGKLDLDKTFVERELINAAVIKSLDAASLPWGIKVTRYEIKNIIPPHSVIQAMEQQMKAEREKRADIAHSEGERSAVINRSMGDRTESINISEGEKQKRINEAEGRAKQIELTAEATAEALRAVATSINQPGGRDAVSLRIAEDFIKQFGDVLDTAKVSVFPVGLAQIQGVVESFSKAVVNLKKPAS